MIIISPGHHASAVGARNANGFAEYPETNRWAQEISRALGTQAMYIRAQKLSTKVAAINDFIELGNTVDVAIEVHFNAAQNAEGEYVGVGSETLYCPGSRRGKAIAEKVQPVLSKWFPPCRGVKEGWYQRRKTAGPLYFLAKTRCPALIIEPEFIQFAESIQHFRKDCCQELAQALLDL